MCLWIANDVNCKSNVLYGSGIDGRFQNSGVKVKLHLLSLDGPDKRREHAAYYVCLYDFALNQLAPSRQYKHYRLGQFHDFRCVCVRLVLWNGKVYEMGLGAKMIKINPHHYYDYCSTAIVIEASVA